jgi:xanthine dehydrogenase YagS FAD-binding subunit
MRTFAYARANTLTETITLLDHAENGHTRPLAGGTDLLTLMKADIIAPAQLIDIKRLGELPRGITESANGITLGALTTLADIEQSDLLRARYPLLVEAAAQAATPQLRNMATIGGNLLQRPRCWYFRNRLFQCWPQGGRRLSGQGRRESTPCPLW